MHFSVSESSGKVWAGHIKPCNLIDGPWTMLHSRHFAMDKDTVLPTIQYDVYLIDLCISSLWVSSFFPVYPSSMWSLQYQQVISRTKICPEQGRLFDENNLKQKLIDFRGHTHPCFVRPDCTVPKLYKKQDFSLRALLVLWSVTRFC